MTVYCLGCLYRLGVEMCLSLALYNLRKKDMNKKILEMLGGSGVTIHQLIVIEGANAQVCYQAPAKGASAPGKMDEELLASVLSRHKDLFKPGSWAVVYCVCRDLYKLENKVAFEMMAARMATMAGLEAPGKGTIQKSIENNGFMSKPVAEWQPVGNNRHKLDLGRVLLEDLSDKVSEG